MLDGRRVLLVVSGGIAAYKSAILVRRLRQSGARVDVVMTASAEKMVGATTFQALSGHPVLTDLWTEPLAHIELGREADCRDELCRDELCGGAEQVYAHQMGMPSQMNRVPVAAKTDQPILVATKDPAKADSDAG